MKAPCARKSNSVQLDRGRCTAFLPILARMVNNPTADVLAPVEKRGTACVACTQCSMSLMACGAYLRHHGVLRILALAVQA